jgi:DNA-binding MarR family transcriptional regulator
VTPDTSAEAKGGTDALSQDLGLFLKHVLTTSNREFFAALQEVGISFTQLKCLGFIHEAGAPVPLSTLSHELVLSPAAISRAVDALVQRGMVKREEDAEDRRSKIAILAPRGRSAYERVMAVRLAGLKNFIEELEPQERVALGSALRPIVERLSL